MFIEEPKALVEWYPVNRALPGLLVEPAHLRSRLSARGREVGTSEQPALLVYKPERRAVLQWGDSILKTYVRGDDLAQAVDGLTLSSEILGLHAPRLLDQLPAARLTVQGMIQGDPLPSDRISRGHLGEAIARVHGSAILPARILSPRDHLRMARVTSRHVAFLLPDIATRLGHLLSTLESRLPPPRSVVPSHGDFNEDQALTTEDGIALLDFDHLCLADPAFDPATLAAYRLQGSDGDVVDAMQALEDVLLGYGRAPENLGWYLAVAAIRRLPFPFRFLATDWPHRVRQIVLSTSELVSAKSP
jgi:hypothetical protein